MMLFEIHFPWMQLTPVTLSKLILLIIALYLNKRANENTLPMLKKRGGHHKDVYMD